MNLSAAPPPIENSRTEPTAEAIDRFLDGVRLTLTQIADRAELVSATIDIVVERGDLDWYPLRFLPGLARVADDISDACDALRQHAATVRCREGEGDQVPAGKGQ